MVLFRLSFLRFTFVDLLDVLVVGYIFYRLLVLMKGTRSAQMATGLFLVGVISFLAFWFQLEGLKWLFANLATVGFIVLVVMFQPELRQALAQIGHSRVFRFFFKLEEQAAADELVRAASRLSELGYGALIVIERNVGLRNIVETGKYLNSRLSTEMLVTIFTPHTPLHDGAAIIRGEYIIAAGCTLPLTTREEYTRLYGMRHKAAVGMSDASDAICVVVSEETRAISLAYKGELYKGIEADRLRQHIANLLSSS